NAQDVHIAGYVVEAGRGLVLALNKWDLLGVEEKEEKVWRRRIRDQLNFAPWAPVSYISAKTGQRVTQPLEVALKVIEERHRRVGSGTAWYRTLNGFRGPHVQILSPRFHPVFKMLRSRAVGPQLGAQPAGKQRVKPDCLLLA